MSEEVKQLMMELDNGINDHIAIVHRSEVSEKYFRKGSILGIFGPFALFLPSDSSGIPSKRILL
jgi:hypothetical protein